MSAEQAIWGRCGSCGHVWMLAVLPMEMAAVAREMRRAKCPECNRGNVFLAKASDIAAARRTLADIDTESEGEAPPTTDGSG